MEKITAQDILLTTVPPWGVESPPLGLGLLEQYLLDNNVDAGVFDFNIFAYHFMKEGYEKLWHVENKNFWSSKNSYPAIAGLLAPAIESFTEMLIASPVKIIGFSVVDPKERLTIDVIKKLKARAPDKKIIIGGPACSAEQQRRIFLSEAPGLIDCIVPGEGEAVLFELVDKFKRKKNFNGVKGAYIRDRNKWSFSQRGTVLSLETISFPKYSGFKLNQYLSRAMIVEWSRGCTGHCAFCKNWQLVKGYRNRKSSDIFAELVYHREKNGMTEFTVCDPLLNGNPAVLSEVCMSIKDTGYDFSWSGEIAPCRDMHESLFRQMKNAGCFKLQIGLESGSDRVLSLMRKSYTSLDAEKTIRCAHKAGIRTEIFVLLGFPGEKEEDFSKTVDFLKRNRNYIDAIKSINTLHIIAGTDLYDHPADFGIQDLPDENWHYMWKTGDGNDYNLRLMRGRRLLDKMMKMGVPVLETNLCEGKETALGGSEVMISEDALKDSINRIQCLVPGRRNEKKRGLLTLVYILFIITVSLFAEVYLYLLKKIRNTVIFPGG